MIKAKIECPLLIGQFDKHLELKDQVLAAINDQKEFDHLTELDDVVDITRTDWGTSRWKYDREWFKLLQPYWHDHVTNVCNELGYEFFRLKEIWFQQYATTSQHGWHVHGSNWTNVYYLEMPEDSPKTQFIDPYTQSIISEFDVKEGDILTFPSFVIHRAPINLSKSRKTIISWNMDTEVAPGLYKE